MIAVIVIISFLLHNLISEMKWLEVGIKKSVVLEIDYSHSTDLELEATLIWPIAIAARVRAHVLIWSMGISARSYSIRSAKLPKHCFHF